MSLSFVFAWGRGCPAPVSPLPPMPVADAAHDAADAFLGICAFDGRPPTLAGFDEWRRRWEDDAATAPGVLAAAVAASPDGEDVARHVVETRLAEAGEARR